jgi:hypothetical protein
VALEHPWLTLKPAEVMLDAKEDGGEPATCDRAAQWCSTAALPRHCAVDKLPRPKKTSTSSRRSK